MLIEVTDKEKELLLSKLKDDVDFVWLINKVCSNKSKKLNRMKIQTLEKLKENNKFKENNITTNANGDTAITLKLLLAIWQDKGFRLYGTYNNVFEVLRIYGVIKKENIDGKSTNVPSDKYCEYIVCKESEYLGDKCTKLFFTKQAINEVRKILKEEKMLEDEV